MVKDAHEEAIEENIRFDKNKIINQKRALLSKLVKELIPILQKNFSKDFSFGLFGNDNDTLRINIPKFIGQEYLLIQLFFYDGWTTNAFRLLANDSKKDKINILILDFDKKVFKTKFGFSKRDNIKANILDNKDYEKIKGWTTGFIVQQLQKINLE